MRTWERETESKLYRMHSASWYIQTVRDVIQIYSEQINQLYNTTQKNKNKLIRMHVSVTASRIYTTRASVYIHHIPTWLWHRIPWKHFLLHLIVCMLLTANTRFTSLNMTDDSVVFVRYFENEMRASAKSVYKTKEPQKWLLQCRLRFDDFCVCLYIVWWYYCLNCVRERVCVCVRERTNVHMYAVWVSFVVVYYKSVMSHGT